jgi:hypothetical protein
MELGEKIKIINPFTDVAPFVLPPAEDLLADSLSNVNGVNIGSGNDYFSVGKDGIRFAGLIWVSGSISTSGDDPVVKLLTTLATGKSTIIIMRVNAQESSGQHGSFERRALIKNTAGALDYYQIQDAFTQMDDDWKVDFERNGASVNLRVWGKAGQDIDWKYNGMILISA